MLANSFSTPIPASPLQVHQGNLTLTNVTFSNDRAISGAAVFESKGSLSVNNCTFNGNAAGSDQRGVSRPQGAACDIGAEEYRVGDMTIFLYLPAALR